MDTDIRIILEFLQKNQDIINKAKQTITTLNQINEENNNLEMQAIANADALTQATKNLNKAEELKTKWMKEEEKLGKELLEQEKTRIAIESKLQKLQTGGTRKKAAPAAMIETTQKELSKVTNEQKIAIEKYNKVATTATRYTTQYNNVLTEKAELEQKNAQTTKQMEMAVKKANQVIQAEMAKSQKQINAFFNAWNQFRGPMQLLGEASRLFARLTIVAGSVTAAFYTLERLFLRVGRDFEEQMIRVAATAEDGMNNINYLTDATRQMAKSTIFTATEIGKAQFALAQAGLNTQEVIDATRASILLAGGTMSDLSVVTGILVSTIKTFGLEFSDSQRVVDIFAQALIGSKLSIDSLAEAMKFGGTAGAAFGMTVQETVAALSQFVDMGLTGSIAGTTLRQSLNFAANSTKKQRDAMASLIPVEEEQAKSTEKLVFTYDKLNPEINSFADIIKNLSKFHLSATQAVDIFGSRAGAAIKTLVDRTRLGLVDIQAFTASLTEATEIGKAKQLYEEMTSSVNARLKNLKTSAQELQIALFTAIGKDFAGLIDTAITKINIMAEQARTFPEEIPFVKFLKDLIQTIEQNIDKITEFALGIVSLLGTFAQFVVTISAFIVEWQTFIKYLAIAIISFKALQTVVGIMSVLYTGVLALKGLYVKATLKEITVTTAQTGALTAEAVSATGAAIATGNLTKATNMLTTAMAMNPLMAGIALVAGIAGFIASFIFLKNKVDETSFSFDKSSEELNKNTEFMKKHKEEVEKLSSTLGVWIDSEEKLKQAIEEKAIVLRGSINDLKTLETVQAFPEINYDKLEESLNLLRKTNKVSLDDVLSEWEKSSAGLLNNIKSVDNGISFLTKEVTDKYREIFNNLYELRIKMKENMNELTNIGEKGGEEFVNAIINNYAKLTPEARKKFNEFALRTEEDMIDWKDKLIGLFKGGDLTTVLWFLDPHIPKKFAEELNQVNIEINKMSGKDLLKVNYTAKEVEKDFGNTKILLEDSRKILRDMSSLNEASVKSSQLYSNEYKNAELAIIEANKNLSITKIQLDKIRSDVGKAEFLKQLPQYEKIFISVGENIVGLEKVAEGLGAARLETEEKIIQALQKVILLKKYGVAEDSEQMLKAKGNLEIITDQEEAERRTLEKLLKTIQAYKILRSTLELRTENTKRMLNIEKDIDYLEAAKIEHTKRLIDIENKRYELLKKTGSIGITNATINADLAAEQFRYLAEDVVIRQDNLRIAKEAITEAKKDLEDKRKSLGLSKDDLENIEQKLKIMKDNEKVVDENTDGLEKQLDVQKEIKKSIDEKQKTEKAYQKAVQEALTARLAAIQNINKQEEELIKIGEKIKDLYTEVLNNRLKFLSLYYKKEEDLVNIASNKEFMILSVADKNYSQKKIKNEIDLKNKLTNLTIEQNNKEIELNNKKIEEINKDIVEQTQKMRNFISGIVKEKAIKLSFDVDKESAEKISEQLKEQFGGVRTEIDTIVKKYRDVGITSSDITTLMGKKQSEFTKKELEKWRILSDIDTTRLATLFQESTSLNEIIALVAEIIKKKTERAEITEKIAETEEKNTELIKKNKEAYDELANAVLDAYDKIDLGDYAYEQKQIIKEIGDYQTQIIGNFMTRYENEFKNLSPILTEEMGKITNILKDTFEKKGIVNIEEFKKEYSASLNAIERESPEVYNMLIKYLGIVDKKQATLLINETEFARELKHGTDLAKNFFNEFIGGLEGSTKLSQFLGQQLSNLFNVVFNDEVLSQIDKAVGMMTEAEQEALAREEELKDARLDNARELRDLEREIMNERMEALMELEEMENEMRGRNMNDEEARAELLTQVQQNLRDVYIGTLEERQLKLEALKGQIDNLNDVENKLGMSRAQIEMSSLAMLEQLKQATRAFYDDKLAQERADLQVKQASDIAAIKSEGDKYDKWAEMRANFTKGFIQTMVKVGTETTLLAIKDILWAAKTAAAKTAAYYSGLLGLGALVAAGVMFASVTAFGRKNKGGFIETYKKGGVVGGKAGIDKNLMMLDVGGYVVNAKATRRYMDTLNNINKFDNGGKVPALVSRGEYYIPPKQAHRFSAELESMNSYGKYQSGGMVANTTTNNVGGEKKEVNVSLVFSGTNIISGNSKEAVRDLYSRELRKLIMDDIENKRI